MREPILFCAAVERGRAFARRWRGQRPVFYCVLGHTDTCLIAGLSSAGVTEELRPLTPAADAEVVLLGRSVCLERLPSNPSGACGPAGITRAALQFAGIDARFVGAGLLMWPQTDCLRLGESPGGDIRLGRGVTDARQLFESGLALGRDLGKDRPYVILGESVPGGTTTALAVLLGLGYAADGRVSGSTPGNAHELKSRVVRAALAHLKSDDPFEVLERVGDPMQPVLAGLALGAGCDVLLAGGSQMVAVAALLRALAGPQALERVAIGTTRWVVADPCADVCGLAGEISPELPVLAANLDFSTSRHPGLCEYERFGVKEGVGAGGACIAASLATMAPIEDIEAVIDGVYDSLLGRLTVL
jgi:uncharacterized protein (TIGR00303 family)